MNKEILSKLLEFLEIDEQELEKQVATGFMIAGVAGLLYSAKKAKEIVERKINQNELDEVKEELKALFATADMILQKHKQLKSMTNDVQRPKAKIKIAHPPKPSKKTLPPPPPPKNKNSEEEQKGD